MHEQYVYHLYCVFLGLNILPVAAALYALFMFWSTLESVLQLLLLWAWPMMQRILHWLLLAMLFLLEILLLHDDSILPALCLVIHICCWWFPLFAIDVLAGLLYACCCVALALMVLVGSTIVQCLGLTTLLVWAHWCLQFLYCLSQKSGHHLGWRLWCNLHLQIYWCLTVNCFVVLVWCVLFMLVHTLYGWALLYWLPLPSVPVVCGTLLLMVHLCG